MRSFLLTLLVLGVAGTAAAAKPYGKSIYECVKKLGYDNLAKVINASSHAAKLKNPKTRLTFMAPDNAALLELVEDLETPMKDLLKKKKDIDLLLAYHMVHGRRTTASWPKGRGTKYVKTMMKADKGVGAFDLKLYRDADGDYQVAGNDNDAQLNCGGKVNLVCGQSIMHSIDEVLVPSFA